MGFTAERGLFTVILEVNTTKTEYLTTELENTISLKLEMKKFKTNQ